MPNVLNATPLRSQTGHGGLPASVEGLALFLDIDGTLLDIAPEPDGVVVPDGLADDLRALSERVGGALVLVTGRGVDFVDALFPSTMFLVAGLHGAEWRGRDGIVHRAAPSDLLESCKALLVEAAAAWPGVRVEDKGAAIAAHYRHAPQLEHEVGALMSDLATQAGDGFALQRGKFVFEIRPRGRDKGDALAAFMQTDLFKDRVPLAVGDDITDEKMFAAANRRDGYSVKVGGGALPTLAMAHVASPADVRAWIESMAA